MLGENKNYLVGAFSYSDSVIKEYTSQGFWLNMTYGDILDRHTELYPDRTAFIEDNTNFSITFGQLKEKVDRFAIALLKMGIKKNDRIIVQLPNRHEFIVAFLAAQGIGAVPVLIIPRTGYKELFHFFSITKAVGWIVPLKDGKYEYLSLVKQIKTNVKSLNYLIMLHTTDDELLNPDGSFCMTRIINEIELDKYPSGYLNQFRPDPNDVAFILATGGTTGAPKCVPRTYNSYLAQIRFSSDFFIRDLNEKTILGLFTPIGHGLAQNGPVGLAFTFGLPLVLGRSPQAKDILEALQKWKITSLALVPTQIEDIVNYPDLEKFDISSLTNICSTGAPIRPKTVEKIKSILLEKTGARFLNAFGSSEGPASQIAPEGTVIPSGSVGLPQKGHRWVAVDENNRELPSGAEGELIVKGPCIFNGYYGLSREENDKLFTPNGYYKTGDIGKIDENGFIFITGRKKEIIMRGGESIPARFIEEALEQIDSVEKAAVVGIPDQRLGEKICAYVKCKPEMELSFNRMIDQLKANGLGVMMLPERLEIIDKFPTTNVGKIDKKALQKDITEKLLMSENK